MAKPSPIEKALREVQRLMRARDQEPAADGFHGRSVPPALGQEEGASIVFGDDVAEALLAAEVALLTDQGFEHLRDKVGAAVWLLACRAFYENGDRVTPFIREHSRPLETHKCFFTVDHLKVRTPATFSGVEFLGADHADVPVRGALFVTEPPVGCVAVVETTGTDYTMMADRGRVQVEHALRLLRIALRAADMGVNDKQLRFRLGTSYSVGGEMNGWTTPAGTAYDLELDERVLARAAQQEVATLPKDPRTGVQRQADIAIRWIEKARFEPAPLEALLFLFFALEALVSRKHEKGKGKALAFRQAMLGAVAGPGFAHPDKALSDYAKVRSAAVHGETLPAVDEDDVQRFTGIVGRTLDQYLRFARDNKLTEPDEVYSALMHHPALPKLTAWLRQMGSADLQWKRYLDQLDRAHRKEATPGELDKPAWRGRC
jgi:hypothetical protein